MVKQLMEQHREAEAVLRAALVGTLGLVDSDGSPYVVPLNYVYIPEQQFRERFAFAAECPGAIGRIIFHCALGGRKLDCLAHEPRVCFNAYREVRMAYSGDKACDCTCRYESATCFGTARIVDDHAEKVALLTALSMHYMQREIDPPGDERTRKTGVVEIVVTGLTGKRNVDPPGK